MEDFEKAVLIFEKPEYYFFPNYAKQVYAPFDISNRSIPYFVYKALQILHLPGAWHFWGSWKEAVKTAKIVVLFDYGYQRGMEKYIRKVNPDCRIVFFRWNMVDRYHKNHLQFTDPEAIYSTDKGDCEKYHFRYQHIFYPEEWFQPYSSENAGRLFFMGNRKGREEELLKLRETLTAAGLECDIRVLFPAKSVVPEGLEVLYSPKMLAYPEYLDEIRHAGVMLDIAQSGQTALTMRVMESIFLSKKLITNNADIVNYDFYDENNIFVLPDQMQAPDPEKIRAFLKLPYREVPEEVRNRYSFSHWLGGFSKQ